MAMPHRVRQDFEKRENISPNEQVQTKKKKVFRAQLSKGLHM